MDDNEKKVKAMEDFGDMVNATEKMSAPWKETVWKLVRALIFTNLFWAVVLGLFIWFAYMTPIDSTQEQDFTGQTQSQSYSEGVTEG